MKVFILNKKFNTIPDHPHDIHDYGLSASITVSLTYVDNRFATIEKVGSLGQTDGDIYFNKNA